MHNLYIHTRFQELGNTLWAYAKLCKYPSESLLVGMARRLVQIAPTMTAKDLNSTMWAYATLAYVPVSSSQQHLHMSL